jgi:hypothetical protein
VKNKYRILSLFFLWTICFNVANAQRKNVPTKQADGNEDDYHSSFAVGITTNTNSGLLGGLMFRKTIVSDNNSLHNQSKYLNLEIVNVKHYREGTSQAGGNGRNYVSGKENYLFAIRPQYGREITLFKRSPDGGVNISAILAGGPTIGLLKPYYLDISYTDAGRGKTASVPASANLSSLYTKGFQVFGAGSFFSGFDELSVVPGANVKLAFDIELDAFRQSNISLEVGFLAEAYTKAVPIMYAAQNRSLFTSGYITVFFGKKK